MRMRFAALAVMLWFLPGVAWPQVPEGSSALDQRVATFELRDETLFDGLAKLNASTNLAFSIERIVPFDQKSPPVKDPRFTARRENATVREILDGLCGLDGRYIWTSSGNMVNVLPRARQSDTSYFMNQRVGTLKVSKENPFAVVFAATQSLPGKAIPLGSLLMGAAQKYPKAMRFDLSGRSIREIANLAATQMGPGWGWELTGWEGYHLLLFHLRLLPSKATAGN